MGLLVFFCVRISCFPFVPSVGTCLTGMAYWTITSVTLRPLWRDNSPTNPDQCAFFPTHYWVCTGIERIAEALLLHPLPKLCGFFFPPPSFFFFPFLPEMNTLPGRKHLIVSFWKKKINWNFSTCYLLYWSLLQIFYKGEEGRQYLIKCAFFFHYLQNKR